MAPMDVEGGAGKPWGNQKLLLSSLQNVRLEWKQGSKLRVVKYVCIATLPGFAIGVLIGLLILFI